MKVLWVEIFVRKGRDLLKRDIRKNISKYIFFFINVCHNLSHNPIIWGWEHRDIIVMFSYSLSVNIMMLPKNHKTILKTLFFTYKIGIPSPRIYIVWHLALFDICHCFVIWHHTFGIVWHLSLFVIWHHAALWVVILYESCVRRAKVYWVVTIEWGLRHNEVSQVSEVHWGALRAVHGDKWCKGILSPFGHLDIVSNSVGIHD